MENTLRNQIMVEVIKSPISERYCKPGDIATLDNNTKQIRCGGAWFAFNELWVIKPISL